MAVIVVTVAPPYGPVSVNTDMIYAVVPDIPGTGTKLLIDTAGGRSVAALEDIDAIEAMLASASFVRFNQASLKPGPVLVNRVGWVSVVPHPQVKGVTQVNFKNHYIAVKASVDKVAAALS